MAEGLRSKSYESIARSRPPVPQRLPPSAVDSATASSSGYHTIPCARRRWGCASSVLVARICFEPSADRRAAASLLELSAGGSPGLEPAWFSGASSVSV